MKMKRIRRRRSPSPQSQARSEALRKRGFISPREAAATSSTPVQTIYTWIREGVFTDLDVCRVGSGNGRVFVSLRKLRELTSPIRQARSA